MFKKILPRFCYNNRNVINLCNVINLQLIKFISENCKENVYEELYCIKMEAFFKYVCQYASRDIKLCNAMQNQESFDLDELVTIRSTSLSH